jgi:hypothetical protein
MGTYETAMEWLALNTDIEWIDEPEPVPCVTASLVMDVFDVSVEQLVADIRTFRGVA